MLRYSPADVDVRRKLKAVPSLTGIRGATAIWVALHHMQIPIAKLLLMPALAGSAFLANGYRGVDLFFILSGFILMRASGRDFAILKQSAVWRFGMARFFRIYPLNTVIMLLMVPFVLLAPGYVAFSRVFYGPEDAYKLHNLSLPGFVQSILLVQTFTVAKLGEWNGPSWSLSAELLGYLMFPLMAFALLQQKSALVCNVGAALCLALLTGAMIAGHHANNNPTGIFGAVRMIFCFTAGMLAHRAVEVGSPIGPRVGSMMTIAAVAFIAVTLLVPRFATLEPFAFLVLIVGLVNKAGPVDWVLRSRLFMWLGAISFSFYMVQETLFRVFMWSFEPALETVSMPLRWLAVAAMIASFLLIAWALFVLIEKPSHRFGRQLADRISRQTSIGRPILTTVAAV